MVSSIIFYLNISTYLISDWTLNACQQERLSDEESLNLWAAARDVGLYLNRVAQQLSDSKCL